MLLSVQQRKELNKVIDKLIEDNRDIEWVTEDECAKYKNTEYESMIIGLGCGEHLNSHLQDDNVYSDVELTYYYAKYLKYFITVFRLDDLSVKIQVYKCLENEGLNGSKVKSLTKIV